MRDPLKKQFRDQIKEGGDLDKLIPQMVNAGFTRREIHEVIWSAHRTGPGRLRTFGEQPSQEQSQ